MGRDRLNVVSLVNDTQSFLQSDVNWREELFQEWEMKPVLERYYSSLCEKKPEFANATRKNATRDFKSDFEYEIGRGSNENMILVGPQGCGKSTFGMAIFLHYQQIHLKYGHRVLAPFISFSLAETNSIYNEVQDYQFIFQDEEDDLEGQGSRTTEKRLGNLIKRARFTGISLIKCCPELTTIEGCDTAILPMGFHREGAVHFRRSGDPSQCWARAMLFVKSKMYRNKYDPSGFVYFYTGNALRYMDLIGYSSLKKESWEDRKSKLGGSGIDKEKLVQKLEEYAEILYDKAIARGWDGNSKTELETHLLYCPDIAVSTSELKHLKNEVYRMYHDDKQENKEDLAKDLNETHDVNVSDDVSEFEPDLESVYEEIRKSSGSVKAERDIDIHKALKDPLITGKEMARKWDLSKTRIRQIRKKITGQVSRIVGLRFEKFYKQFLEREFKSVTMDGGQGKPDAECMAEDGTTWFISIKCYEFSEKSYTITYEEAKPEIEQAQKMNLAGARARVRQDVFNIYDKNLYKHILEEDVVVKDMPIVQYRKKSMHIHLK